MLTQYFTVTLVICTRYGTNKTKQGCKNVKTTLPTWVELAKIIQDFIKNWPNVVPVKSRDRKYILSHARGVGSPVNP